MKTTTFGGDSHLLPTHGEVVRLWDDLTWLDVSSRTVNNTQTDTWSPPFPPCIAEGKLLASLLQTGAYQFFGEVHMSRSLFNRESTCFPAHWRI